MQIWSLLINRKGGLESIDFKSKALSGFIRTDRNESGVNSGDGSLTAKTWNGIMKNLGISGCRIKNSISSEEFNAFLEKYGFEL